VAMGASVTIESDSTAATAVSGQALLIGIDAPQSTWVMTPGMAQPSRTVSVRVYDPGSRPASVTISSPVSGEPLTEIATVVPAGEVRDLTLPLPPGSFSHDVTHPSAVEGPIVVRTAEGVGVVVARITVRQVSAYAETVSLAGATANPCDDWLVPTGSVTGTAGASPAGSLVVSNPGSVQAEVEVDELTAASGSSPATLTTLVVGPGGTATATLHPTSGASLEGLEVRSSSPVVAEQDYHAASAIHALAVGPSPVVGVPVLR